MSAGVYLADAGNIGIIISAVLTTGAVVAYAVRSRGANGILPWWRTPFGLHLMAFMMAFAVVLDESAGRMIATGTVTVHAVPFDAGWFVWLSVLSYLLLVVPVLGWRLWIIFWPPGRRKR